MKHPVDKLFRFNLFTLLFWLLSATAFAGSPEIGAAPGCKAAVGLANLAAADVKEAFKRLDQTMKKTDQVLKESRQAREKFNKMLEAYKPRSSFKLPPRDEIDRAQKKSKQAQSEERTNRELLMKRVQTYDEKVAESFKRCGGPQ